VDSNIPSEIVKFEAKKCWGGLTNDTRTFFANLKQTEIEFYKKVLLILDPASLVDY